MNAGRGLVGLVLVGIGALYVFEAFEVLDAGDTLGRWWPTAVIGLGVLQVADRGRVSRAAVALVVVGSFLLAITTGALGADAWAYAWPGIFIGTGVWLVLGWGRREARAVPDLEQVDALSVLSAVRTGTRSARFRNASVTAVLGGVTLDLLACSPDPAGAVVDATCVLGSVTVLVPRGWSVEVRGIPLLGGWDDTTDRSAISSDSPRVEVRALVVLGGVEVKHATRWSGR